MKIKFTPTARRQFLAIIAGIAVDRPMAARRVALEAKAALKRLERHPASGRRIPEFPGVPHREVVLPPYRFFYRQVGRIVWIVAVWHGAQIPDTPPEV